MANTPSKHVLFTEEEDKLLITLKETSKLSWKNIAKHFPGRSQGALQVHYCREVQFHSNPAAKAKRRALLDELLKLRKQIQACKDRR